MPLHVARLRDSDLAAEGHPEGCWYAVLLWSAAWHQLPAGSLPAGEAVLARLCGLGRDVKTFRKHRGDALRGWIECDDGRLYHPVVAEQVNASWSEKLAYRERKKKRVEIAKKAAEARWSDAGDDAEADAGNMHEASKEDASCMPNAMPKGRGRGRGRGTGSYSDAEASAPAGGSSELVDPEKIMFQAGTQLLTASGVPPDRARKMLGKWRRDYSTEAVITALGTAKREGAIDPLSFIEGTLNRGSSSRKNDPAGTVNGLRGSRPNPLVDEWRAAKAAEAAEQETIGDDPSDHRRTGVALSAIGGG